MGNTVNPSQIWSILQFCVGAIAILVIPIIVGTARLWNKTQMQDQKMSELKSNQDGIASDVKELKNDRQRDREIMLVNFAAINAKLGITIHPSDGASGNA